MPERQRIAKEDETVVARVQLFVTCLADMVRPQAAIAAVRAMERRGVNVEFPSNQTCCGQFSYNAGYQHEAAILARHFLEVFETGETSHAETEIVSLSGSCAAMVIHSYPQLLFDDAMEQGEPLSVAEDWKRRAQAVGTRIREWGTWMGKTFGSAQEKGHHLPVAYHLGCHMRRLLPPSGELTNMLKAQGILAREPDDADQCCGFGGTYSFTEPAISTALADDKLKNIDKLVHDQGAVCLTSADLGCLLHLAGRQRRQGSPFPACHISELVDLADQNRLTPEHIESLGDEGRK